MLLLSVALLAAGCGSSQARDSSAPSAPPAAGFALHSPAVTPGGRIPTRFTCDGSGARPPLSWTRPPTGTKTLALAVDDPDAPGGTFTHWILVDLPATARALPARGEVDGRNSAGSTGWTGPCPPAGKPHHYVFRLFAVDGTPVLKPGFSRSAFNRTLAGHVLAETRLTALYGRS